MSDFCNHSNYDDYFEKCTDCNMTKEMHPNTTTIWRDGKQYFFQWSTEYKDGDRIDYIGLTQTCDEPDPDDCDEPHETFDFQEIHQ